VLSASRGSILVLLGGWAAIGAGAAVQSSGRTRALVRWAALPLLAAAITVAMTSALFFPAKTSSGSGLAAVDRRNSEQAPEGSLAFRRAHSRAAVEIFRAHPLAGVGFGGYRAAAPIHLPAGVTLTPYVHNGYLQAAVDGGQLLAVPLAAALLAAVLALLRGLRRRWRALAGSPAEAACALAAMALLAHSAIDMDWVYPALVALVAALLAVAVAGARGQATSPNGR
jgi:O-antigen ligase